MKKIGFITIGQSPRDDIMSDLLPTLGNNIEIVQRGALDALSDTQLQAIAPQPEDTVLVSSLRSGAAIAMSEKKILPLLQSCIEDLEEKKVAGIMLLCTGDFKNELSSMTPLIYPNRIIRGLLPALCAAKLAVLVPEEDQKEDALRQWREIGISADIYAISPYENTLEDFQQLGNLLKTVESDYILMDCMGYSSAMKEIISSQSGKHVLLPRTLSAAVLKELI